MKQSKLNSNICATTNNDLLSPQAQAEYNLDSK